MQVFVSGTWSEAKASAFASQGLLLGQLLAKNGFDLACGPGTGMARHVIDGYRSVPARGIVRYYLPSAEAMKKAGEEVREGADEIIQTEFDYPIRNIYQVRASNGLFILTGGDGTLEEAIPALADYKIPVGAIKGSGTAVRALELLLDIYPVWADLLIIDEDVEVVFKQFKERLLQQTYPT